MSKENFDGVISATQYPDLEFEIISNPFFNGILDTANTSFVVATTIRSFEGPELIKRCNRAWENNGQMYLEYNNFEEEISRVQVIAILNKDNQDQDLLTIVVRLSPEEVDIYLED